MNFWYRVLCFVVVFFLGFIEIELTTPQATPITATSTPAPVVIPAEDGGFFLEENLTRELLCDYFESHGLKIKYSLFVPLVEKDDGGLYGGKERWFVTLEDGTMFPVWTKDGKIEFVYGTEWYYDIPIYYAE